MGFGIILSFLFALTAICKASVIQVEIDGKADADWPANKVRHVFGPKEKVYVRVIAGDESIQLTGTLPHHGVFGRDDGGCYFTTPDQPGGFTVDAMIGGALCGINCACIAPVSLRGNSPRSLNGSEWNQFQMQPFVSGEVGVVAHIDTYLEPDYVSFKQLRLFEGVAPPTDRQGWYLDRERFPDSAIGHTVAAGASSNPAIDYCTVIEGNKTSNGDCIGSWVGTTNVCSNGLFRLDIPLKWYTAGCIVTNSMPDNVQTIWVFDNGSMRVNKNGLSWQREANGLEYRYE